MKLKLMMILIKYSPTSFCLRNVNAILFLSSIKKFVNFGDKGKQILISTFI